MVRNEKEVTPRGVLYRMSREVGELCLAHQVAVSAFEPRAMVAWRLREARRQLREACGRERVRVAVRALMQGKRERARAAA